VRRCRLAHRRPVDARQDPEEPRRRLAAEEDIGADVEICRPAPGPGRSSRCHGRGPRAGLANWTPRAPSYADLAMIGQVDAGDRLDQGRLAGAVVAGKRQPLRRERGRRTPARARRRRTKCFDSSRADRIGCRSFIAHALGQPLWLWSTITEMTMTTADRDELPERLDVDEDQAELDHRDDQRADHRADDGAGTAEQAGPRRSPPLAIESSSSGSPAWAAPAVKRAV